MLIIVLKRGLQWLNLLLITALLLSSWLPYLNPRQCWIIGFTGLFFPFLFVACILFASLCWWHKNKKYLLANVIALLCGIPAALDTWGLHVFHRPVKPGNGQFTLMTYNSSSMGLHAYQTDTARTRAIYDVLEKASPDMLCIQEFYTNDEQEKEQHLENICLSGRYSHHFFTQDKIHWNTWHYGIVLFSRYPIIAATAIPCGESKAGSGSTFLQADVAIAGDTIRVFSVQLTSYMFNREDYQQMRTLPGKGLLYKMRLAVEKRAAQAVQLAGLVAASPYPTIVCGDFNDTPASFTYKTISRHLQDVFLATGSGWGRTLSYLSPSLRIDYILPQPSFEIHGGQVFPVTPSEHFPVMACLSLKKH